MTTRLHSHSLAAEVSEQATPVTDDLHHPAGSSSRHSATTIHRTPDFPGGDEPDSNNPRGDDPGDDDPHNNNEDDEDNNDPFIDAPEDLDPQLAVLQNLVTAVNCLSCST
ncbi:hypothetical protein PISMIDRAFT_19994 [Pisolithus microcarpus 441]|uniref:Uncharacterized protein n=1 Tax=Pisolithus microcarpus 441 TaxID=765257 RepID=A0A0C9YKL2_9AGAM|nr:hypothetical protein PISMIDRAFT_19994 [Pisolithus microcarpus 441]